jgi:hypothetical protein
MYKITDILTGHYGHYANVFKQFLGVFAAFWGVWLVVDAQLGANDLAGGVELKAYGGLGLGER